MTSLKTGNEEDEQINRVKENDLYGRDVDITCWISREKHTVRSWLYRLESEVDAVSWRFRFEDNLYIEYD